jgi:hypothetical protein
MRLKANIQRSREVEAFLDARQYTYQEVVGAYPHRFAACGGTLLDLEYLADAGGHCLVALDTGPHRCPWPHCLRMFHTACDCAGLAWDGPWDGVG